MRLFPTLDELKQLAIAADWPLETINDFTPLTAEDHTAELLRLAEKSAIGIRIMMDVEGDDFRYDS